jgi:hypothetical protein
MERTISSKRQKNTEALIATTSMEGKSLYLDAEPKGKRVHIGSPLRG